MPQPALRFLCISSYEKGQDFMRQLADLEIKPTLLTVDSLRNSPWPQDILEEIAFMPDRLNDEQILNTVTWMSRGRKFDRLTALDEFDMEVVAKLREHMRIPVWASPQLPITVTSWPCAPEPRKLASWCRSLCRCSTTTSFAATWTASLDHGY